MKNRKFIVLLAVALLVVISATLVACNTGKGSVSYTVSFVVDGEVVKTAELDNFSKINGFYKPTKEGYTFGGWYLDADFTEKFSTADQLKDDLTLYAKFTRKSFVVDFFGEDGTLLDSQNVWYGESATAPQAPEVSGKKFVGWSEDFSNVTAALSVYALYDESAKFTVKFASLGKFFWQYEFEAGTQTDIVLNTAYEKLDVPSGLRFDIWKTASGQSVPSVFPAENLEIEAKYDMLEIEYLEITSDADNYEYITYSPDASLTYFVDMPTYSDPNFPIEYSYEWSINRVVQDGTTGSLTVSGLDVGTYVINVLATAYGAGVGTVTREASITLTVTPAYLEVPATGTTVTYDGQAHGITVNSLPDDVVEYKLADGDWTSTLNFVNAGTYEVYYRVSRANYYTYESPLPTLVTIYRKELIGTITTTNLVYGDTLPTTYEVNLTGFIEGEDESAISGNFIFTTSIQDTRTIGTFDVFADTSALNTGNYYVTMTRGIINVDKRVVTVTANDLSVKYCDEVGYYPLSYDGFIAGENANSLDVAPTATSAHKWDSPAGEYEIVVSGGEDDHYTFEYVSGTLTVVKKVVTITAKDATIVYGTKLEDVTFAYSSDQYIRDEITVTFTAPNYSTTLGAGNTVDLIPYTESENYEYWFAKGKLTVVKRTLTATASDQTIYFGDNPSDISVTYTGFAEGENLNVLDRHPETSDNYTPGVSGIGTYTMVVSGGYDDNYNFNYVSATITVVKRPVTVKVVDATIVYGSSIDTVTLDYDGSELVGNHNSLITLSVPDFVEGAVPGTTFAIKATSPNENYDFTFVDGTLTVIAKEATITADNKTIVYGENLDTITLTYTAEGLLTGDVILVTLDAEDYVAGATPGTTFTIKATSTDNRYALTFVDGTLTVLKKDVTVTADNATVVYGSDFDTNTATCTTAGLVGEDTLDVTYATDYTAGQDAGKTFDVIPSATHDYYNIAFVNGTLTVLKKDASVTVSPATVTYGDSLPTLSATTEGAVDGDTIAYDFAHGYVAGVTPVGQIALSATLGNNPNYNVTVVDGTLTVSARELIYNVTAETASIWSNSVWTNAGLVSGHVASGTLTFVGTELGTYTYPNGFEWTTAFDVKADGESVLANYNPVFTVTVDLIERDFEFTAEDKYVIYNGQDQTIEVTDVILSEDASTQGYKVKYSVDELTWKATPLTFKNAGDYKVYYVVTPDDSVYYPESATGYFTLHISAKEVVATADNKSKTYGDTNPTFTGSLEGVCDGDVVEIEYFLTNNADGKNVGEYTISASFATEQPNYTLKVNNGTLTVAQRDVTITADDKVITYGDTVNFNSHGYTAVGIQYGETIYVTYSTDYVTGASVGEYTITPALNGEYNNYNVTLVDGTLTVGKKDATVTANNVSVIYGNALPTLTSTITGLVGEDTVDVTYGHEYAVGAVPGTTLAITPSATHPYYNFTFVDGTITVVKKNATVTANNASVIYGNTLPTLTSTITGLVGEDTVDVTYTSDYIVGANAGATFAITPSATHPYYNFTLTNGTLTVDKRPATVTAGNTSVIYGSASNLSALDYEIDGLLTGDSATVVFTSSYNAGNGVGTYDIVPHATNNNYLFTAVNGTLTVTQKDVTIVANNASVVFGNDMPTLSATVTGAIDGCPVEYTLACAYTAGTTGVGNVAITVSLGNNPNYNVTTTSGTLTVTARPVTITANDAAVVYGKSLPELTAAPTGAIEGCPINHSLSSDYTVGDNAGTTHTIIVSLGNNPNYSVTAVNGTLTVVKADYDGITHPAVEGGVYSPNKTLADHSLNAGFSWVDSTINPTVGNAGYQVLYNADPTNYNDFLLSAVKVNLTKAPVVIGGSTTQTIDYTAGAPYTFNKQALTVSYNGTQLSGVFEFTGVPTYTVASTYQFTAVLSHQNYEGSVLCTFIIKSVDVGGTLYTIEDALNVATSGNAIVKANTAFSSVVGYYNGSQYYTVKSGVTLLLPYKDGDTTGWINGGKAGSTEYNSHPNVKNGDSITPVLYVSLDIPSSVTLNVSGTLTVGAKTGIQDAGTKQNDVTGGYAQINLSGNIVVNSATLNVYGYIKGTGKITATGSTAVTENMYLSGWMGGSISAARFIGTASGKSVSATTFISSGTYTVDDPTMFPFNQYELRAIQTTLELQYGTSLRGIIKIATSEQKVMSIGADAAVNQGYFNIVSSSTDAGSALIRMLSADAKVTKSFGNDRVRITTDGTIADGYADISTNVISKTVKMTSEKVIFPLDGRIDLVINSGTFTQNYQYKLLPGATLTVNSGATLTSNNTLITYKNGFTDIATYPYPTNRGDAKIVVAGTLNANKAIGGDVFGATGGKLVVGASTTVTSVKSLEGTGTMARSGLKMVFTFSESNSQVRDLTLNGTTKGSAGTTYTYNGSTWA